MVRIIVFGPGADAELHRQLRERARSVAAQFDDQVVLEEQDARSDAATQLAIAGSPALAVDDDVVCVGSVPSVRRLLVVIERHVAKDRA